jgi:phosphatidate cytidylyltransferase
MSPEPTAVTSTPVVAPTKMSVLLRRLFSTAVLWLAVIATLVIGWPPGIFAFTAVAALVALHEFYRLLERGGLPCDRRAGLTVGVLFFAIGLPIIYRFGLAWTYDFELTFLAVAIVGLTIRQLACAEAPCPGSISNVANTLLGLLYVAWLLNFLTKVFMLAPVRLTDGMVPGVLYIFYLLAVTKFSDIGAYCVGSLIGRHKMIPRISPGKTWEGFAGALFASAIISVLLVWLFPNTLRPISLTWAVPLGLALGLAAVLGDLVESLFKRATGCKDSGMLFPGIGGMLDLIDSVLFTAPVLYIFLRLAA